MPFSFVWHYFDIRGRWDEIVKLNDRAIDALAGEDSHTLGRLLSGQSVVHERMYSYKQRLETAIASYEMFLRLGIECELPLPINEYSAGIMETDRARAYELRHQGYDIAMRCGDNWMLAFTVYSIGELLLGDSRLDEADPWLSEALAIAGERLHSPWALTHTCFGMGSLKYAQGDFDKARQLFEESLASSRKIGYPNVAPWALVGLSGLSCEVGDFQKAKMYAEEMEVMERDLGREGGIGSALLHIANAYDGLGEYDVAVRYIRDALDFRLDPLGTVLLLSLAGRMLVRRGAYEPAAELLQYIAAQPIFARLSPFERREAEAALQKCCISLPSQDAAPTAEYDGKLTIDSALALVSKIL
jgi:tetratricopeptide (TPR) repeat protein